MLLCRDAEARAELVIDELRDAAGASAAEAAFPVEGGGDERGVVDRREHGALSAAIADEEIVFARDAHDEVGTLVEVILAHVLVEHAFADLLHEMRRGLEPADVVANSARKMTPHGDARHVQALAHGAARDADDARDLIERAAEEVEEGDDARVGLAEVRHRGREQALRVAMFFERSTRFTSHLEWARLGSSPIALRHHESFQPRRECGRLVKLAQLQPRGEKRVLRRVLRLRGIAERSQRPAERRLLEAADELRECGVLLIERRAIVARAFHDRGEAHRFGLRPTATTLASTSGNTSLVT